MRHCFLYLLSVILCVCMDGSHLLHAQPLCSVVIKDAHFVEKKSEKSYYFIGANLGNLTLLDALEKSNGAKSIAHAITSLKERGVNNVSISLDNLGSISTASKDWNILDKLLQHLRKEGMCATIGIPINSSKVSDNYESTIRYLIKRYRVSDSKNNSLGKSIITWKLFPDSSYESMRISMDNVNQIASLIKSIDEEHLITVSAYIPVNSREEQTLQNIMELEDVDFVSIIADPYEMGWITASNFYNGLARVYVRTDEGLEICNRVAQRIGKPYILSDVCYPRDAMARMEGTLSDARDSYFSYIFSKLYDSCQHQMPLSAIEFCCAIAYNPLLENTDEDKKASFSWKEDWMAKSVFLSDKKTMNLVESAIDSL